MKKMFTQSCSFLHNNKQSSLTGNLGQHHNLGLLASCNYSNLSKQFGDLKPNSASNLRNVRSRSYCTKTNVNPFVNSSYNNTRIDLNMRQNFKLRNMEQGTNCKEVLEMSSLPFTSSFLVGGFVGSKSQLGRHLTKSCNVNMWDIIRDLGIIDLFENNSSISDENIYGQHNSNMGSGINCLVKHSKTPNIRLNCTTNRCELTNTISEQKETQGLVSKKQSYADVTKMNLPMAPRQNCEHSPHQPNAMRVCSVRNSSEDHTTFRPELSSGSTGETSTAEVLATSKDSVSNHPLADIKGFMNNKVRDEIKSCESLSRPVLKSILKNTHKKTEQLVERVEPISSRDLSGVSCVENRDRIVSQCSDDSECSFIVFEHDEDDSGSVNNDGDVESDDGDATGDSSSGDESDEDSLQTSEVS